MGNVHTHTGICQACGRRHAVNPKSGKLAKHGYTVDWGFFNGTCQGSDHPPLEQDTTLNIAIVAELRQRAARLDVQAEGEILKVEVQTGRSTDNRGIGKPVYELVDRERFDSPEVRRWNYGSFDREVELVRSRLRRQAELFRAHAADLDRLRVETFGRDLTPRVEEPELKRETFQTYRDAAKRVAELKAAGHKAQQRRQGWTSIYTVTYR